MYNPLISVWMKNIMIKRKRKIQFINKQQFWIQFIKLQIQKNIDEKKAPREHNHGLSVIIIINVLLSIFFTVHLMRQVTFIVIIISVIKLFLNISRQIYIYIFLSFLFGQVALSKTMISKPIKNRQLHILKTQAW